jgi:hypothetical protein
MLVRTISSDIAGRQGQAPTSTRSGVSPLPRQSENSVDVRAASLAPKESSFTLSPVSPLVPRKRTRRRMLSRYRFAPRSDMGRNLHLTFARPDPLITLDSIVVSRTPISRATQRAPLAAGIIASFEEWA